MNGRHRGTRAQILEAALGLFSTQGYSETTVRQIATRCGVTDAALYYHFRSKAHILQELVALRTDMFEVPTGELSPEQIATLLASTVHRGEQLVRLRLIELLVGNPIVAASVVADDAALSAVLKRACEPACGESAGISAAALVVMNRGEVWNQLLDGPGAHIDEARLHDVLMVSLRYAGRAGAEKQQAFDEVAARFEDLPAHVEEAPEVLPESMRERILAAALRRFGWKGFDAVTVREIARACGVTDPTLFHYFPTKRAIMDAILADPPLRQVPAEHFERLPGDFAEQHVLQMFDVTGQAGAFLQLLDRECLAGDEAALAFRRQLLGRWRGYLEGEVHPALGALAPVLAGALIATVLGLHYTVRLRFGAKTPLAVKEPAVRDWACLLASVAVPIGAYLRDAKNA